MSRILSVTPLYTLKYRLESNNTVHLFVDYCKYTLSYFNCNLQHYWKNQLFEFSSYPWHHWNTWNIYSVCNRKLMQHVTTYHHSTNSVWNYTWYYTFVQSQWTLVQNYWNCDKNKTSWLNLQKKTPLLGLLLSHICTDNIYSSSFHQNPVQCIANTVFLLYCWTKW